MQLGPKWNITSKKITYFFFELFQNYRNPSLGLVTKAKACKGVGQERSPRVTSYVPQSVGEWRNEHSHSQVSSHFGSWNPDGLPDFQREIAKVKTHWIEKFFISLQRSWKNYMSKVGSHDHLDTSNISYGQKKSPGVKLTIWLPTTKSLESPQFPCV
jgi:hypothetical protein